MLMTVDGKFVAGNYGGHYNFMHNLTLKTGILEPDSYIILIDPKWNESADYDK